MHRYKNRVVARLTPAWLRKLGADILRLGSGGYLVIERVHLNHAARQRIVTKAGEVTRIRSSDGIDDNTLIPRVWGGNYGFVKLVVTVLRSPSQHLIVVRPLLWLGPLTNWERGFVLTEEGVPWAKPTSVLVDRLLQ